MIRTPRKRKTVKHFHEPGQFHELTFSCYRKLPLLADPETCRLLGESIDRMLHAQRVRLLAFVFMPDHVHLLIDPGQADIDQILFAIKQPYSVRVKRALAEKDPALLRRLTIRERPGKMSFRFWQEGPGYDRNLFEPTAVLNAIDYIHNNPVRKGLCASTADWRWSSWKHYHISGAATDSQLPKIQRFAG